MNNKGWSLNELLAGLGVLTFCLVFSVILFQSKFNHKKKNMNETLMMYTYESIEASMVSSTQSYIEKKYSNNFPDEEMKITIDVLRKKEHFSKYKDPKDGAIICDGYVIVEKENWAVTYHPYVKCGDNYETTGYKAK
ncbi:MAG: hypothetical protein PHN72_04495 [Bacilli bacterium]|nr:hypothetical protein [Bacilli bacterium]